MGIVNDEFGIEHMYYREASRGEPSSRGTRCRVPELPGVTLRSPPAIFWSPFQGFALRAEGALISCVLREGVVFCLAACRADDTL